MDTEEIQSVRARASAKSSHPTRGPSREEGQPELQDAGGRVALGRSRRTRLGSQRARGGRLMTAELLVGGLGSGLGNRLPRGSHRDARSSGGGNTPLWPIEGHASSAPSGFFEPRLPAARTGSAAPPSRAGSLRLAGSGGQSGFTRRGRKTQARNSSPDPSFRAWTDRQNNRRSKS